eukprot:5646834-Lingulodinium_polyedra.AAC.1
MEASAEGPSPTAPPKSSTPRAAMRTRPSETTSARCGGATLRRWRTSSRARRRPCGRSKLAPGRTVATSGT